jgi:phosphatidylserine/phosphatidylglycerophosphate/cardiolipin synthase-like enzyme
VEPIFSYPTATGLPDHRHEDVVKQLLREAVPGTAVHFTIFTFTRETMAEAFIQAADRGLDLNLLVDERRSDSGAVSTLLSELPNSTQIVRDGGVGDRHNHNKFLLVEELLTGGEHVVWQSSSNFTDAQRHWHNTSVVVRNDTALYNAYRSYWDDLADEDFQNMGYNRAEAAETATVYFSPRDDEDTHVSALENVVPSEDATIRFLMSIWTESRESESGLIAGRLAELVDGGCDVKVVMQQRETVPDMLADAGIEVVEYPDVESDVHSKNMLIDADFETDDGVERRREVWTGSQNLSRPGLRRNDEALLRIVDDQVYRQFRSDWERVYWQALEAHADESPKSQKGQSAETLSPSPTPAETTSPTAISSPTEIQTTGESGPGFGFGTVAAGFVAATAYAARVLDDDSAE